MIYIEYKVDTGEVIEVHAPYIPKVEVPHYGPDGEITSATQVDGKFELPVSTDSNIQYAEIKKLSLINFDGREFPVVDHEYGTLFFNGAELTSRRRELRPQLQQSPMSDDVAQDGVAQDGVAQDGVAQDGV